MRNRASSKIFVVRRVPVVASALRTTMSVCHRFASAEVRNLKQYFPWTFVSIVIQVQVTCTLFTPAYHYQVEYQPTMSHTNSRMSTIHLLSLKRKRSPRPVITACAALLSAVSPALDLRTKGTSDSALEGSLPNSRRRLFHLALWEAGKAKPKMPASTNWCTGSVSEGVAILHRVKSYDGVDDFDKWGSGWLC